MNSSKQKATELIEKLSRLLVTNSQNSSLPEIAEKPTERGEFQAFCHALINEGQLHNTDAWAAHMTPSVQADGLLGQVIAGLHNGNLLSPQLYPILSQIEHQLINWFCSIFQQSHGHFTSGSTYANLEALWHAREHIPDNTNVVYGSAATHYSVVKACQILGLTFQAIATDNYDRIDPDALEQACRHKIPIAIILTIGTSACGAIDPLEKCITIRDQYQCWCHIDAAWGGALVLLPEFEYLTTYLAKADSISFDPHKSLHQPKSSGMLLYQRPLQPMLLADEANYLVNPPRQTLPGSYGGELFLPLWVHIISNGVNNLKSQIKCRLHQAYIFASQIEVKTNWWVHSSGTGIVCFQSPDNIDLEKLVIKGVLSRAKINEQEVYRIVFASHTTQAEALLTELSPYF